MTDRKKKGIAAFASGAIAIALGFVFLRFEVTPDWVDQALVLVGLVTEFFGFKLVYPDHD